MLRPHDLMSPNAPSTQNVAAVSFPARGDVVDVGRLLDTFRRQWKRIAVGLIAGLAIAVAYMRIAVPRYQAVSTVRIDARQSTLPSIYSEQTARDEVFTEIEVLRSRTLAADVVDSLSMQFEMVEPKRMTRTALFSTIHVDAVEDTGTFRLVHRKNGNYEVEGSGRVVVPGRLTTLHGTTFVLRPSVAPPGVIEVHVRSRDEAITMLRKAVDVGRSGLQASIIALSYESTDPALARDVLNAWTSNFIRRRQSVQRSEASNTAAFIQAQLDTLNPELARAENRLLAYREANKIVAPELEANTEVTQTAQLQATRSEIEAERSALDQALRRARASAETASPDAPSPYRELLGFPTLLRNQAASELLRSLASLDEQRTSLLIRRTSADPDVVTITERIQVVEKQLQGLTSTYLRGLTAQVASVDNALSGHASRMRSIPTQQVEYARLQRAPRVYEELVNMLQTRLKEAQITEAVKDASVRIVDPAVAPIRPSNPNPPLVLAFGLVGGVIVGTGMAFWREGRTVAIHTRRDLQEISDVPVLGLIPNFDPAKRRIRGERASQGASDRPLPMPSPLALVSSRDSTAAALAAKEAFVRLFLNVQWSGARVRTMLVTSPLPGDGKTTSALYLAAAAVSQQRRVLLVDADLRCGGLTSALALRDRPGLVDLVAGTASLDECVKHVTLMDGLNADVVGAGSLSRVVGVPQLVRGLQSLLTMSHGYDLILIDTPPINVVADAAALASLADGVLLVARAGATPPMAVDLALDQLHRAGANMLGVALNAADLERTEGYGSMEHYRAYTMARA